jgi:hypothetical protein
MRKEKEMRRILLALALVAVATTAANATTYVWWEIESASTAYTVTSHGQGQTLVIEAYKTEPGIYTFNLGMWIATDGTGGTVNGMSCERNNLWRGTDTAMTMGNTPEDANLNPLAWTGSAGSTAGSQNNGDSFIKNLGRARQSGGEVVGGTALKFINFTLIINAPLGEQVCDTHYIYQTVGSTLYAWAPATPLTLNKVVFGANPFVYGNTKVETFALASDTELPVIAIHTIPEPATLALLGFGALALLRRR